MQVQVLHVKRCVSLRALFIHVERLLQSSIRIQLHLRLQARAAQPKLGEDSLAT